MPNYHIIITKNAKMKKVTKNSTTSALKNLAINQKSNQGKIVQRYNISKAFLESYFIPSKEVDAFELARSKQDLNAHSKYGIAIRNLVI